MNSYKVLIEGYDADAITNKIVERIISGMDLDKLKNEVKNKIIQELKGDIVNSSHVKNAVENSIEKIDKIVGNRVNEAATKKIEEINSIVINSFKLVQGE